MRHHALRRTLAALSAALSAARPTLLAGLLALGTTGPARAAQLSDGEIAQALAPSLLPYVEQQYATLFPGSPPTQTLAPYVYRCYSNGNCAGFTANDLYLLGPVVNSLATPVWVGTVAGFCDAQPLACGLKLRRQLVIGGLTREYLVHIPWRVRQQANLPVVVMLHGTTGTGAEFYDKSGWREKADTEGFIAVFPTALRHCFFEDDNGNGVFDAAEIRSPTKWADTTLGAANRPLCTAQQRATLPADAAAATDHPLADDLAFFRALVADVTGPLGGDARRLYVTGFSNGAQMAHRLAHEASDLVAAAAANAGLEPAFGAASPRPMSMVFVVGSVDDRFTGLIGGAEIPATSDIGAAPGWQQLLSGLHQSLALSPTAYSWQPMTAFGQTMSLYTYATSTANPAATNRLLAVVVQGLAHAYPDYMPAALWPFFLSQRLP